MTMQAIISLKAVRKSYRTRMGVIEALKGIDFQVGQGEFVAIVGPSGSGKSTLINVIAGIDHPTDGDVHVAGYCLNGMSEDHAAQWRCENIGVVFQFFQLLPTLTAIENVMMPLNYAGTYHKQRQSRAMELLDRVGLSGIANLYPAQLSGGEQQRVAIARALANNPKVIVGDEPTGNLDPSSAGHILRLFEDLVAQGTTIVIVTHDRDLAGQVPRVVEVRDGQLFNFGAVDARLVARQPVAGRN